MGLFGWGEKEEKKPEEAATTSGGGTAAAAPPPAPAAAPGSAAAAGTTTGTAAPTVGTAPAAATGTASATATGAAGTAPVGGTAAGGEAAVKQIDPPQVEPLTSKAEREQMEAEARKKAEEKADRRAKAQLRFHTCGNLDCDVMRLPPWLPRNPERNPAKKAAPAPRRIALHEGWPHLFIETGDGPRAFSAAPCVTVCMTAREKRIVVEGCAAPTVSSACLAWPSFLHHRHHRMLLPVPTGIRTSGWWAARARPPLRAARMCAMAACAPRWSRSRSPWRRRSSRPSCC